MQSIAFSQRPARSAVSMGDMKLLFTPGPLTTSAAAKSVMLGEAASRDPDFIEAVLDTRPRLLAAGGARSGEEKGYLASECQAIAEALQCLAATCAASQP